MLTALHLGNFKAFAETQNIPIRPITLIFGPNSAGKSSIIHSLAMAHEASRKGELDIFRTEVGGSSIDLGGFRQFVHRRQASRRVEWGVTFDTSRLSGRLGDLLKPVNSIAVHLTMGIELDNEEKPVVGATPQIVSYELESSGEKIIRMSRRFDGIMAVDYISLVHPVIKQIIMAVLETYTTTQKVSEEDYISMQEGISEIVSSLCATGGSFLPKGISLKDSPQDDSQSMQSFFAISRGERDKDLIKALRFFMPRTLDDLLSGLTKSIEAELQRIQYLGPLRSYPPRHLAFSEHDDINWYAGGGYAWDVVRRNANVRGKVNEWLRSNKKLSTNYELIIHDLSHVGDIEEIFNSITEDIEDIESRYTQENYDSDLFGDIYKKIEETKKVEFPKTSIQELVLKDLRTDTPVSHRDVGIGISQVLPVLVGAYASQNQIIAIEQPEIHLHPALQAELGDVFIESALGMQKNSFILETHSEHLILRFMRRIRETYQKKDTGLPPITPKDISVLYVEPDGSRSIVREMPLNAMGELVKAWPGGFFEEGLREQFGDA